MCVSDEVVRQSCGSVIHAINLQSPDVLQKHSSLVLPLVYFAMHQRTGRIYHSGVEFITQILRIYCARIEFTTLTAGRM